MEEKNETTRDTLVNNYPANSRTQKVKISSEKMPEDKKVEKVIQGTARKRKKGFFKKLAEAFIEDDTKSVGNYILYDILIPAAKDMINDMGTGALEMLLFGERRSSGRILRGRGTSQPYTNYNSVTYRGTTQQAPQAYRRDISRVNRSRHDFGEIVLDTRGEAEDVLAHLFDLTVEYGMASVADLYELVGAESQFTDNKYGWRNLSSASVVRVRDGYLINLPRTELLD